MDGVLKGLAHFMPAGTGDLSLERGGHRVREVTGKNKEE